MTFRTLEELLRRRDDLRRYILHRKDGLLVQEGIVTEEDAQLFAYLQEQELASIEAEIAERTAELPSHFAPDDLASS